MRLFEIIDDELCDKIYLVMEYLNKGSILDKLATGSLDEEQLRKYFRDLISGLEYCHEVAWVVHRDIKPENLMLDEKFNVKLVDFGVCYIMPDGQDTMEATAGSPLFQAPEML